MAAALPRYHRLVPVRVVRGSDGEVVLSGGPLDGRLHHVGPVTTELVVVMEDGARHLYDASDNVQGLPDGRVVPVYEYRGREHPLRSAGS